MSRLAITFMDVGWGDSILIEAVDGGGTRSFALIDSNDTSQSRSSFLFTKRFFERNRIGFGSSTQLFEFVLATHNHADHIAGLKGILKVFGAKRLLYPDSLLHPAMANVVRYAHRSSRVGHYQIVDDSTAPFSLGPASVKVLWPPPGYSATNENHFSVVLAITLDTVTFVLTGDAEADVWPAIVGKLPASTKVFQVPHHGAGNGLFSSGGMKPWLTHFLSSGSTMPEMGMSSHIVPHSHPDPAVVAELDRNSVTYNRTDADYHVTFETDGTRVDRKFYR